MTHDNTTNTEVAHMQYTLDDIIEITRNRFMDGRGQAVITNAQGQQQCLYRTPEGIPCVAGAVIADEDYCEEMDHTGSVYELHDEKLLPEYLVPYIELLHTLQQIHDENESWDGNNLTEQAISKVETAYTRARNGTTQEYDDILPHGFEEAE